MRPNRKIKKPDSSPKLILKEVIGLTTKNANILASNISNPNCVYVAGCVVVVYNVELDTQSHLMVSNRTPKPLSCVAMSKDGSFVAAGEQVEPKVLSPSIVNHGCLMYKPHLSMIWTEVSHFLVACPDIHLMVISAKDLGCLKKPIGGASHWTGVGLPFILSVWIFKIPQGFGI